MIDIKICDDVDYIRSVIIEDPEMYGRSVDDHTNPDSISMALGNIRWLECNRDGERVGLSAVKVASNSVLNLHIHIPKQHRGIGTLEIGRAILLWVVNSASPKYQKINTKVPVIYKDVIRFAHKLGFVNEGIDRLSIMKNGKLTDRQNLGITFNEVRA